MASRRHGDFCDSFVLPTSPRRGTVAASIRVRSMPTQRHMDGRRGKILNIQPIFKLPEAPRYPPPWRCHTWPEGKGRTGVPGRSRVTVPATPTCPYRGGGGGHRAALRLAPALRATARRVVPSSRTAALVHS